MNSKQNIVILINGDHQGGKDTFGSMLRIELNKEFIERCTTKPEFQPVLFKVEKYSAIPNEYFRQFTGVNFLHLEGEEKEKHRNKFVDFCQTMKKVFGDDFWSKKLKESVNLHYRSLIITDFYFKTDLDVWKGEKGVKIFKILVNNEKFYDNFNTRFDHLVSNEIGKNSLLDLENQAKQIAKLIVEQC